MTRSPSSIRLVLVATVLAAAIFSTTALWLTMQRDAEIEGYRSAVMALGNGMGRQTTRWISSIDKALVETRADMAAAQAAVPDPRARRFTAALRGKPITDALARRRQSLTDVADVLLIDTNGQIANASRNVPPQQADVSDGEIYRHFRDVDDKGLYVSRPAADALSGERVVFLARRLDGADGGWLGIVAASVTLRDLAGFYADVVPSERTLSLWRSDGVLLARFPRDDMAVGRKIAAQSAWYGLVAGGGGTFEGVGEFGPDPVVGSVRPLPGLPLVIETTASRDAALANWTRQRPWFVMGALIAITLVILLLRMIEAHSHRLERSEQSLLQRNRELETTRLHLNLALANVSHGVSFFDGNQRLIVCNRRYAEMFRLPEIATRPGTSHAQIIAFANDAGCGHLSSEVYPLFERNESSFGEPVQKIVELADGRFICVRRQPMPDGGWVGTQEDVTERRRHEQRTEHLAQHDVLTGLANRALFNERMALALASTTRGNECAVILLDLDRFKAVNDTLGHQVGDALLREVAARLKGCVRAEDTVARLGGDEFAILQDGLAAPGDVAHLAERLVEVVSRPYVIDGHDVCIGVSIGITIAPGDGNSAEFLVRNADLALYRAKSAGRGVFRFFEPGMDASAQDRLKLEHDLRDAIVRGEFLLHYQPIVELRSGALRAYEALIRWNHPTRGLLGPEAFLSTIEDSGLIVSIGEWALEQACGDAQAWPDEIRVVLNISDTQFRRGDISDIVSRTLGKTGFPGARLELDMNETALLQRPEQTLSMLHQLRAQGVIIALDDFGAGPSSLSGLRQFPFDKVKVDGSCIRDIGRNQDMLFTVRAILRLCADLGIHTVVEGVETPEQRDLLLREHCDQAQGYLFGRPRPADELSGLRAVDGVTSIAAANATREFARRAPKVAA